MVASSPAVAAIASTVVPVGREAVPEAHVSRTVCGVQMPNVGMLASPFKKLV
jgi:hypothetical protein